MPDEEDQGTDSGVRVSERTKQKPAGGSAGRDGNRGAHGANISTRRPSILIRPEMPSIEVGGVKYFGYDHNPVRQDKAMVLSVPQAFDLRGRKHINASIAADLEKVYSYVPSFRHLDTLWDQAYDFLRQRAEDEKGYRHLPADLNSNLRFRQYIELYMAARMMLGELTSWQHLSMFDRGHMQINEHARKVSRSRVNGAWEALGAIPMFPTFVALADFWSKPVFHNGGGVVYHPSWIYSVDQYAWGATVGSAVGNIQFYSGSIGVPETPDTDSYFTEIANTVDTLLSVLTRRHSSLSANDKADIQSMQGLFRMMELPTHPMRWDQWTPMLMDEGLLDTLLFRGLWMGEDKTTSDNGFIAYPNAGTLGRQVEIRGQGAPNPMTFAGLIVPLCVLDNDDSIATANKFSILGARFSGMNHASTRISDNSVGTYCDGFLYSDEDGWSGILATRKDPDDTPQFPWSMHQYHGRAGYAWDDNADMHVNDPVDFEYYMPIDDVGSHYLAYVSQALGLPYV